MATYERAVEIAGQAHAGQLDKAGADYLTHPLRMAESLTDPGEKIVALLHDVVEKSDWTLERLRAEGFPPDIVEAVDALTRREGEDYAAFVDRAGRNPLARPVKLADLRDNIERTRLGPMTEADEGRLIKYAEALKRLQSEQIGGGGP